jgi:ribosomal protein S18 acetylase RimI-like enzyme
VRFVVDVVEHADHELLEALRRLVPQLSASAPPLQEAELAEIVASPTTTLFVAREVHDPDRSSALAAGGSHPGGHVVGTLTLAVFRIPTGIRAWIEDVVVDEAARGRGVGRALVAHAIERARAAGARTVELTSRPSRVAANRLYERLGFARRDTNVYRLELT